MPVCAIKNCKSNVGPNSAYYSYNFPKADRSPERFSRWRRHSGLKNLIRDSRVCSIHFRLEDFDESDIMKLRLTPNLFKRLVPKLKEGAVPSLSLGNEGDEDATSSSASVELRDVGEILAAGRFKGTASPDPGTSWMFPTCEIKIEDDEDQPRSSVGVQCEFGTEVYRGSEAVDK